MSTRTFTIALAKLVVHAGAAPSSKTQVCLHNVAVGLCYVPRGPMHQIVVELRTIFQHGARVRSILKLGS